VTENTLFIQAIQLNNYRSYSNQYFEFDSKLNCITGDNGIGKTNLLDAVYYGCFSRSYFQKNDSFNYTHAESFLRLKLKVSKENNNYLITIVSKNEGGKKIEKNGNQLEKITHHLGEHPVVFFAPGDIALIEGGSEERRRLIDGFIGQLDKAYVENLSIYKKILLQRKSLLEIAFKKGRLDFDLLASYNEQLCPAGNYIHEVRKKYSSEINEKIKNYYHYLSEQDEEVDWNYISHLHEGSFQDLLNNSLQEDRVRCTTSSGIHKDDYDFGIKGMSLKKTGSQGQQKTYLLALKLAMYDILKEKTKIKPILLLDDIFDKLDSKRINKLFDLISQDNFGQIFISHTNKEDIVDICLKHGINPHLIELKKETL
jgi:DNA replication and repair protein RecF